MELGDRVIYYTHEGSDLTHRTVDVLAFVTNEVDDETIDLVAFPPEGPVAFYRVSQFDPEGLHDFIGLTYWRPHYEAPPDFAKYFAYANEPEWINMVARHAAERAKANPKDLWELKAKQKTERAALYDKLEKEKAAKKADRRTA